MDINKKHYSISNCMYIVPHVSKKIFNEKYWSHSLYTERERERERESVI